jgi:hypothetical protein
MDDSTLDPFAASENAAPDPGTFAAVTGLAGGAQGELAAQAANNMPVAARPPAQQTSPTTAPAPEKPAENPVAQDDPFAAEESFAGQAVGVTKSPTDAMETAAASRSMATRDTELNPPPPELTGVSKSQKAAWKQGEKVKAIGGWEVAGRTLAEETGPFAAGAAAGMASFGPAAEVGLFQGGPYCALATGTAVSTINAIGAATLVAHAQKRLQNLVNSPEYMEEDRRIRQLAAQEHPQAAGAAAMIPGMAMLLTPQGEAQLTRKLLQRMIDGGKARSAQSVLRARAIIEGGGVLKSATGFGRMSGAGAGIANEEAGEPVASIGDETIKGLAMGGPLHFMPMATKVLGDSLAAKAPKGMTAALALAFSSEAYDATFRGKPFDAQKVLDEAKSNVPAFVLMEAFPKVLSMMARKPTESRPVSAIDDPFAQPENAPIQKPGAVQLVGNHTDATREVADSAQAAIDKRGLKVPVQVHADSESLARAIGAPVTMKADNATITSPDNSDSAKLKVSAYHGTPHTFEPEPGSPLGKVKKEKVGSGEGAAAYGWGVLYAAENKGVADTYTKAGDPAQRFKVLAHELAKAQGRSNTVEVDGQVLSDYQMARRLQDKDAEFIAKLPENIRNKIEQAERGNLYHIEVNAEPEDMLDWDKPLSEQSEGVRKALGKHLVRSEYNVNGKGLSSFTGSAVLGVKLQSELRKTDGDVMTALRNLRSIETGTDLWRSQVDHALSLDWSGLRKSEQEKPWSGQGLYRELADAQTPKAASEYLASLGIKGIRYADQGSRGAPVVRPVTSSRTGDTLWQVDVGGGTQPMEFASKAEADAKAAEMANSKTYNYVIFDENDIRVIGRNGEVLPPSEAMNVEPRFKKSAPDSIAAAANITKGEVHIDSSAPEYRNADGTVNHKAVEAAVVHEAIGHVGIERALGKEKFSQMAVSLASSLSRNERRAIGEQWGMNYTKPEDASLTREQRKEKRDKYILENIGAEHLATIAENAQLGGVWRSIMDKVVVAYNRTLRAMGAPRDFTDAEVRDILRKGERAARKGDFGAAEFTTGADMRAKAGQQAGVTPERDARFRELTKTWPGGGQAQQTGMEGALRARWTADAMQHADYLIANGESVGVGSLNKRVLDLVSKLRSIGIDFDAPYLSASKGLPKFRAEAIELASKAKDAIRSKAQPAQPPASIPAAWAAWKSAHPAEYAELEKMRAEVLKEQAPQPRQSWRNAYEMGKRAKADGVRSEREFFEAMTTTELDSLPSESPGWNAFFRAGFYDKDMPEYVTGWRYGKIPESDQSTNFREQIAERGVSLMRLDGEESSSGAKVYEMFNRKGNMLHVGGWYAGRGTDGEPLIVGAKEIKSAEVAPDDTGRIPPPSEWGNSGTPDIRDVSKGVHASMELPNEGAEGKKLPQPGYEKPGEDAAADARFRELTKTWTPVGGDILPHTAVSNTPGTWRYIDSSKQRVEQLQSLNVSALPVTKGNRIYAETVDRYIRNRTDKHPVVFLDSKTGKYFVDDGNHRIQAAKARGEKTVLAWVRKGLTGGMPDPRLDAAPPADIRYKAGLTPEQIRQREEFGKKRDAEVALASQQRQSRIAELTQRIADENKSLQRDPVTDKPVGLTPEQVALRQEYKSLMQKEMEYVLAQESVGSGYGVGQTPEQAAEQARLRQERDRQTATMDVQNQAARQAAAGGPPQPAQPVAEKKTRNRQGPRQGWEERAPAMRQEQNVRFMAGKKRVDGEEQPDLLPADQQPFNLAQEQSALDPQAIDRQMADRKRKADQDRQQQEFRFKAGKKKDKSGWAVNKIVLQRLYDRENKKPPEQRRTDKELRELALRPPVDRDTQVGIDPERMPTLSAMIENGWSIRNRKNEGGGEYDEAGTWREFGRFAQEIFGGEHGDAADIVADNLGLTTSEMWRRLRNEVKNYKSKAAMRTAEEDRIESDQVRAEAKLQGPQEVSAYDLEQGDLVKLNGRWHEFSTDEVNQTPVLERSTGEVVPMHVSAPMQVDGVVRKGDVIYDFEKKRMDADRAQLRKITDQGDLVPADEANQENANLARLAPDEAEILKAFRAGKKAQTPAEQPAAKVGAGEPPTVAQEPAKPALTQHLVNGLWENRDADGNPVGELYQTREDAQKAAGTTVGLQEPPKQTNEPIRDDDGNIGLTFSSDDKARAENDLPERDQSERRSNRELIETAADSVSKDPQLPQRIIDELKETGRKQITREESGVLLLEKARRQRNMDEARDAMNDLSEEAAENVLAIHRWEKAKNAYREVSDVHAPAVSEAARQLQAQQVKLDPDLNYVEQEKSLEVELGRKPTDDEIAERHSLVDSLRKEIAALRAKESRHAAILAKRTADARLSELVSVENGGAPAQEYIAPEILERARKIVEKLDKAADAAEKDFMAKWQTFTRGGANDVSKAVTLPAEMLKPLALRGASLLAHGALDTAEFTAKMVERYGPQVVAYIGQIRKESDRVLRGEAGGDAKVLDVIGKTDAKPLSLEVLKGKAKALADNGTGTDLLGNIIDQLARYHIQSEGIKTIDSMTDALRKDLSDAYPQITGVQIHNAWSRYGKSTLPDQAETEVAFRDLKAQALKLSQLNALATELRVKRTGAQRDPPSDEVRRLQQKLHQKMKEAGVSVGNTAEEELQSIQATIAKRLSHQLADMLHYLDTGENVEKTPGVQYSEANEAVRAIKERVRAVINSITPTDPQKVTAAKIERAITQYERLASEAYRMMGEGVTERPSAEALPETPELKSARDAKNEAYAKLKALAEASKPQTSKEAQQAMSDLLAAEKSLDRLEGGSAKEKVAPRWETPRTSETAPILDELYRAWQSLAEKRVENERAEKDSQTSRAIEADMRRDKATIERLERQIEDTAGTPPERSPEADAARAQKKAADAKAAADKDAALTPEQRELKQRIADLRDVRKTVQKLNDATQSAEERLLAYRIAGARKRADALEQKLSVGDTSKKAAVARIRYDTGKYDQKLNEMQRELDAQMARANTARSKIRQAQLENEIAHRSGWEKKLDWWRGYRRFAILSAPTALVKIPFYGINAAILKPLRILAESVFRNTDTAMRQGRYVTPASLGSYFSALPEAWSSMKKTFAEGKDEIKAAHETDSEGNMRLDIDGKIPRWMTIPQRLHEAEKAGLRTMEYRWAQRVQDDWVLQIAKRDKQFARGKVLLYDAAMDHGFDPFNPVVRSVIDKRAWEWAKAEILMEPGVLAGSVRAATHWLERVDPRTGKPNPTKKVASVGITTVAPILTVPENYFKQTMRYQFGAMSGLEWAAKEMSGAARNLNDEQAWRLTRRMTEGAIGAVAASIVIYSRLNGNPVIQRGSYDDPEGKEHDGLKPGKMKVFGHPISKFLSHHGFIESLVVVDNMARTIQASGVSDEVAKTFLENEIEQIGNSPITSLNINMNARTWGRPASLIGSTVAGMAIPLAFKQVAERMDPNSPDASAFWWLDAGNDVDIQKRAADKNDSATKQFFDSLKTVVPVLRQQVPEKQEGRRGGRGGRRDNNRN